MGLRSGEYPQTERRLASDYRMADYQALLIRAIATMPGTCTLAARYAIYERARKAQLAQLRTLCPPLPESEIAHEEEALDQAIALVEFEIRRQGFHAGEATLRRDNSSSGHPTRQRSVRASKHGANRCLPHRVVQPRQGLPTKRAKSRKASRG